MSENPLRRHPARMRLLLLGVLALALMVLARVLPLEAWLASIDGWIEELGYAGWIAFAALYVVLALVLVPGSVLTAAAGALFGLAAGTAVAWAASVTAAALAFLIGRHLAREATLRKARAEPRFQALDRALEQGSWRVVALLRLSPVVPYSLANYLFGVTAVGFWPYLLASAVAMLPGTFLYVYLGSIATEGLAGGGGRSPAEWALLAAGLVATAAAVVYVGRLARKELHGGRRTRGRAAASGAKARG